MQRLVDANATTLLARRTGVLGGRLDLRPELRGERRRAAARLAAVALAGSLVVGTGGGVVVARAGRGPATPKAKP